jgi:transposase InsO family protein
MKVFLGRWAAGLQIRAGYNRIRRHSSIGMQSPTSFEKLHQQLITAA